MLDKYPISVIDELFDKLYGSKVFSSLDMMLGYPQVQLNWMSLKPPSSWALEWYHDFLVMPSGCNSLNRCHLSITCEWCILIFVQVYISIFWQHSRENFQLLCFIITFEPFLIQSRMMMDKSIIPPEFVIPTRV